MKGPRVHKNYVLRGLWQARIENVFPEIIIHKLFDTNSSF